MYVAHRCALMAFVHGAFLGVGRDGKGACACSTTSSQLFSTNCSEPSGLPKSPSSDIWERRLKRDEHVCVERAVEGRLELHSGSGLDSVELKESIDQFGYREGVSAGTMPGAGVLGGEKVLPRTLRRLTSSCS